MFKNIVTSKDQLQIRFELHDVPLSVANAIRRVLLVEIPFIAIDRESISFRVDDNNINTSNFHDEFLIHRLSFMRLKIDPGMSDPNKYKILICNPTSHDLPFVNSSDDNIDFTSDNLVILHQEKQISPEKIFMGNFLITKLKPGQQLKASMLLNQRAVRIADVDPAAILAKTRYHYQPCRVKFCYKNPRHEDGKLMITDDEFKYYGYEHKIPRAFIFEICGFTKSLLFTPKNLLISALRVIKEKINQMKKFIENSDDTDPNIFSFLPDALMENTFTLRFSGEGHTLGNMLAEYLRITLQNKYPSEKNYIAYQKAHPLEEAMVIKIKIDPSKNISHQKLILNACDAVFETVTQLQKAW